MDNNFKIYNQTSNTFNFYKVTIFNQTELINLFGLDGRNAKINDVIYDATTNRLYSLYNLVSKVDALDVANYRPLEFGSYVIGEWVATNYSKGSMVGVTAVNGSVTYFISTQDVTSVDIPNQSNYWFKISTELGSVEIPRQVEYISLDKTSTELVDRTFEIVVNSTISLNGNRIPLIQVIIRCEDDTYQIAYPKILIHKETNITLEIVFNGDLQILHSDSTNNVIVTLI